MPNTPQSRTTEALRTPLVRQFSMFLENRVGSLLDVTRILSEANVHICGISVVDTTDAAVVRIVVDDPERCREVLREAGIAATEAQLVVAELPRGPEKLDQVLRQLLAAEVNVQYTYSLMVRPHDKALLAMHCDDADYASEVLTRAGFTVLKQSDISR
jgi:hypothetical protein